MFACIMTRDDSLKDDRLDKGVMLQSPAFYPYFAGPWYGI